MKYEIPLIEILYLNSENVVTASDPTLVPGGPGSDLPDIDEY